MAEEIPGPHCIICGGTATTRLDNVRDSATGEAFSIVACTHCGLGWTVPVPRDLGQYYSAEYYGGRHGFTANFCDWRRMRLVRGQTVGVTNLRLLDIGCGEGSFALAAGRSGWQPAGVERSPDRARAAGLQVYERLVDATGTYGCITLWHVLEHMENLDETLRGIKRLLDEEGVLLIAVPDARSLQARLFGRRWLHLDVPRHLFHFSQESLIQLLAAHGLEGKRIPTSELEYDLMGWVQSFMNCWVGEQNLFLKILTGKPSRAGFLGRAVALGCGAALCALALPPACIGGWLGREGTLIVAARRRMTASDDTGL